METLRKLSSMRRSKDSSKEVAKIVEQQPQASEEQPPQDELLNGGATTAENDQTTADSPVAPSPPRARVTDDVDDDVEDVAGDDDVEDVAGDDDGYDSAVDKMGTSSTSSVVEEPVAPRAAEPSTSVAQADETDETKTEERDTPDSPRTPSGSGSGNGAEAEAEADEDEVDEKENDGKLSRQASRVMPVAKLSSENEEPDEDVDSDDDEEVDVEEEYEEANDQVLFEDDDAASVTQEGDSPPRIIARETADDQFEGADAKPSSEMEEEVEQAASTPLPDQADDSVEKSINTEVADVTTPQVAEEETEEKSEETEEKTEEETEERSDEASPAEDDAVADVVKDEDSSDVVEKATADVTSDREDEDKQEEDDEVLHQATSQPAESEPVDTGVKEADAPEVVPLATAEVGNVLKESEGEETAEDVEEPPREASSSLTEELRKLSESRSSHEQSADSEEVVPADVTDTEAPDEPSQSNPEPEEESATVSEPVTEVESQPSASNSLVAELKKLSDARSQREASEASEASAKSAEETTSTTGKEEEEEQSPESADSSVLEEVEPDQKVIEADEDVSKESLDELKELTYGFHMQGRPESEASEVQSALDASPEEKDTTESSSVAVSETHSPLVAEVKILENLEEEPASATVKEELSKEEVESPAVVPSPAKLYTALKAVDDELPPLKSENGNAGGDTGNVQVKPRGFSAADFTGDSDGEDEDDENEDDDDEDDDEDQDEELDTAKALAELANAVQKSGNVSESGTKPSMGAAGPSLPSLPQRPAVRKSAAAATALDTAGRITQRPAVTSSTQLATTTDESANGESAEVNETREKLQSIRVKFLRLAHRLGQSPQNVVVAQVLYRLGLAESLRGGNVPNRAGAFSFDRANALAEEQEAANQEEELDFACTILVLGKTGVGKSATINSIFDDRKSVTSAFKPSTTKVQEIVGTVHGIKVRVIDTPGLLPSVADQQHNERIMGQVKKHIKKASPDIVLYFDRLDMQSRDYGDLPLLRTITDLFGAAVWFNAIVVLTHASSAPPDGPNGAPLSYEMFVAQRSHVVQQTIRQAAGDMRLMNPVSLVENHPACRTNRNGQRVLPNGQIWKPQLLLLCFASKILAEANSLLKLQETATPGRPFGQRSRVPPLPFLLSSLLQSRAQLKLPDEQLGESDESDDEEEEDDSDADDYDELPPFRPLSKEELEELDNEQKQDYVDEIADRERLFQKKQYREEMRRRKEMKKRAAQMSKEELAQPGDDPDDEAGKAAAVPVAMPDMALPPSFDSDNPTHRYRYLETANQWLVRPVLETHGWDHDAGYDGFNVEKMFVVKEKVPASISGQVTKDKKEAQVNFEAAASLKHGEGKVTLTGFDIQTIGKDLAYTLRAETRFNNFKRNKTTAGLTCTVLNDTIAAGLKLEDRILIGKRIKMVVNGGVLTGKGDKAFGGSLEATLRGKEYPLSRTLSTLGLSVMDWHGDLAIGGNLQSQFMVGKTMLVGRANLNNRGSGQLSVRASSSEQLQMVLIGIVPILRSLINCRFGFGGQSSQ